MRLKATAYLERIYNVGIMFTWMDAQVLAWHVTRLSYELFLRPFMTQCRKLRAYVPGPGAYVPGPGIASSQQEFSNGAKVLINPDICRVLILSRFFIGNISCQSASNIEEFIRCRNEICFSFVSSEGIG